jgi:hypothetical protein
MTESRQKFGERKLLALLDAWEHASNPGDPKWLAAWRDAEIEAGLPCYGVHVTEMGEVVQVNTGPGGWHRWAGQVASNAARS